MSTAEAIAPAKTVTVTGAAGNLGYSLLFRIGVGRMFGSDTPIRLRLLDLPHQMRTLEGVAMELQDSAYPLVESIDLFDETDEAFDGANAAILVGAHPRQIGMERADLLEANARIFADQGRQINAHAADDIRVLVVGNPVNTNALITACHAPDIPKERFAALMRLDHNRAIYQVARRARVPVSDVHRLTIWGNHSRSSYPDITHAIIDGKPVTDYIDDPNWVTDFLIPMISNRGAMILEARGHSSQGSAANAAVQQMRDWYQGTPPGDWTSAGVWSNGEYGVPEGVICSFPVTSDGQNWHIVPGLEIDAASRAFIDASVAELVDERDHARRLGLL